MDKRFGKDRTFWLGRVSVSPSPNSLPVSDMWQRGPAFWQCHQEFYHSISPLPLQPGQPIPMAKVSSLGLFSVMSSYLTSLPSCVNHQGFQSTRHCNRVSLAIYSQSGGVREDSEHPVRLTHLLLTLHLPLPERVPSPAMVGGAQ